MINSTKQERETGRKNDLGGERRRILQAQKDKDDFMSNTGPGNRLLFP